VEKLNIFLRSKKILYYPFTILFFLGKLVSENSNISTKKIISVEAAEVHK
jgi:hypothetical protein